MLADDRRSGGEDVGSSRVMERRREPVEKAFEVKEKSSRGREGGGEVRIAMLEGGVLWSIEVPPV